MAGTRCHRAGARVLPPGQSQVSGATVAGTPRRAPRDAPPGFCVLHLVCVQAEPRRRSLRATSWSSLTKGQSSSPGTHGNPWTSPGRLQAGTPALPCGAAWSVHGTQLLPKPPEPLRMVCPRVAPTSTTASEQRWHFHNRRPRGSGHGTQLGAPLPGTAAQGPAQEDTVPVLT